METIAIAKKAFLKDITKKFPKASFSDKQIVEYDSISGWNLHTMFMAVLKILPFETYVKLETVLSSAEKQALERELRQLKEDRERLKKLEEQTKNQQQVTNDLSNNINFLQNEVREKERILEDFINQGNQARLSIMDKTLVGIGETVGKVREEVGRKVQKLRKGLEDTGKAIQQGAQKASKAIQQGVQKGWKTFTSWFS